MSTRFCWMMYSSFATSSSWKRPLLTRKLVSWLFSGILAASGVGRCSKSHRSLPSRVNFRMLSCGCVPLIQMNPLLSAITVWRPAGHFGCQPGPPHAFSTLPC
jgi:hypothetical protein